jgi:hypothetical protein
VLGITWIIGAMIPGISSGAILEQKPAADTIAPSMANYKVVFWFDGTTWRSQAYDVRRGEYTVAVDNWVKRIEFDAFGFAHPGHMATVREISLPETPVETFKERLAAAIRDELERTLRGGAGAPRQSWTHPLSIGHPSGSMDHVGTRPRPTRGPTPSPGSSGVDPTTLPQPSPFPYPYPRPHP